MTVKKVKAHQDKETKYKDLTFEAQRNVDCDAEAGQKVKEVEKREYNDEVALEVGALLWCSRGGITGDPYKWMLEQEAQTIVQKRLKMSERAFNEIDWNVHKGALKRISPRERQLLKRMLLVELPTRKDWRGIGTERTANVPYVGRMMVQSISCSVRNWEIQKREG